MKMNTHNISDLAEIDRFEQSIQAFHAGAIDADRFTAIRLQQGVYGQRQQGGANRGEKDPGTEAGAHTGCERSKRRRRVGQFVAELAADSGRARARRAKPK